MSDGMFDARCHHGMRLLYGCPLCKDEVDAANAPKATPPPQPEPAAPSPTLAAHALTGAPCTYHRPDRRRADCPLCCPPPATPPDAAAPRCAARDEHGEQCVKIPDHSPVAHLFPSSALAAANAELAKVREELKQAFNINAEWERKSREDLDTAAAQFATLRAERDAEKARADAAEKRAEEAVAKAREWEALAKRFSANYDAARARAEAIQRDHGADLSRLDKWRLRAGVAERRIAEAAGFLRLIIQPSDNVQAAINALTPPSVSGGAEGEGGEVSEDAWLHTLDPCPSCKHWRSSHERQTGRCRRRGCRCVKFNAPPATDWKALATRLAEALRETTGGLASLARVERHPAQTPTEAAAVAELARLVVVGVDALAAFDSARGAGEGKNEP
jgi:hypothetical protein